MSKKEKVLKEVEAILKPFETREEVMKFKDGKFNGLKPRESRLLESACKMHRKIKQSTQFFGIPTQEGTWCLSSNTAKAIYGSNGRWVYFVNKGLEEISEGKWYPTNEEIWEDMENVFNIGFEHGAEAIRGWFKPFINIGFERNGIGHQTVFKIELNEETLKYF